MKIILNVALGRDRTLLGQNKKKINRRTFSVSAAMPQAIATPLGYTHPTKFYN